MDVVISPRELSGSVAAVASKSEAHRILVCAAFADAITDIDCNTTSDDIDATISCLESLGARVARTSRGFRVVPVPRSEDGRVLATKDAELDCGESGSTLRFLLPVVAALGCGARITGRGRLAARPLSPLYEELVSHGVTLSEQGAFPLTVSGSLRGGSFVLPGDVSSQFVSGLLMAGAVAGLRLDVSVTEPVQSRPYIGLTTSALERFGIRATSSHEQSERESRSLWHVSATSKPSTPGTVAISGDWSNASVWLAAGALSTSGVEVTGLDLISPQGDRSILGALALLGGRVSRSSTSAKVTRDTLSARTINVSDCPDLVPALSAVACMASGTTRITGAARLRLKESDRLETVSAALRAMGGKAQVTRDGLEIEGVPALSGGVVDAANDHRIAMMAAVCASFASGPTTIRGAECVAKSYPDFFSDLESLGGSVSRKDV